jgi:hypothetical protein
MSQRLEGKTVIREGKNYTLRSSATRAAKEDGLSPGEYDIVESPKGFHYKRKLSLAEEILKDAVPEDFMEPPPPVVEPTVIVHTETGKPLPLLDYADGSLQTVQYIEKKEAKELAAKQALEAKLNPPPPPPPGKTPRVMKAIAEKPDGRLHKSKVDLPTKLVWHIADEMTAANPNVLRKTVMAECQRRGIAFYTARTQYQQWLTAMRESKK